MRHNGVAVFVRQDQVQAGMPMIAAGAIDLARDVAARNVAALAESVRQGYTIVATEPSAVLALTHEYPMLLDNDEDALAVAQHTQEACHYLWQLHLRGRLKLNFQPQRISVGYHVPCHLRALGVGAPAENLLRLVPGMKVNRLEKGCSGMAGLWGVKRENYRASLRAGRELISTVRDGPFQIGTTECSTCKMQMEQGSDQTDRPPHQAARAGLRPDARNRRLSALRRQAVGRIMKVRVKLFAVAKELAGCDELTVELPAGATIGDLRSAIVVVVARTRTNRAPRTVGGRAPNTPTTTHH